MARPFNSELVIEERISHATLKAYHVGFDQNKFRLEPLVDLIRNVIPEFALGYYLGNAIPLTQMVDRLKEAARTIYTTDKYKNRGEFGELILHLLLRDFCGTIPLISKIWFKDSDNSTVHGFDGVQVAIEEGNNKLWLGESKIYRDGKAGVSELANDIKKHVEADYLRKEFHLLSKKLPENVPEIEYFRNLMDKHQTLDKIYSSIVIPLVCTYSSRIFKLHSSETKEYLEAFSTECNDLHKYFLNSNIVTNVEFYLMLLPIPDKQKLIDSLDARLKAIQRI